MRLEDALEELRECVLRDASTLKNGPPDSFWTDRALLRYLNEARSRFARKTLCIRDQSTPEVTQVVLANGVDTYTLHPSVIVVVSARHADASYDMRRVGHSRMGGSGNESTDDWATQLTAVAPGQPNRFNTDEGIDPSEQHASIVKFYGTPDATQDGKVVYLRVARKPLVTLTEEHLGQSTDIEMPDDYALDVLEWAAYRALRNWDLDAEDRAKAVQHRDRFEEAVKECKRDMENKLGNPVQWRFGGGGFSYIKN